MKKLIGVLVVLGIFLGGSFATHHYFYGGEAYYTKITADGEMSAIQADNEEKFVTYTYEQAIYNKGGERKQMILRRKKEHPSKANAYLKPKVNPRKGVLSREEIKVSEVSRNAVEKTGQQSMVLKFYQIRRGWDKSVYMPLERETKMFFTSASRSFFVIFVPSGSSYEPFIQLNIGS